MNRRYTCLMLFAGLVAATVPQRFIPLLSQTVSADTCESTIDGAQFPEAIPGYVQWEPLLKAVAASDQRVLHELNLDSQSLNTVVARVAPAVARANELRSQFGAEVSASEELLTARDDLIRRLPKSVFDSLQSAVTVRARQMSFKLPKHGKRESSDGTFRCLVSAKFAEDPHLVPEAVAWQIYFQARAAVADRYRTGDETYSPNHIADLQTHVRISAEHMRLLLTISAQTVSQLNELRQSQASQAQISDVVMAARAELIRSLPVKEWLEIKNDAGPSQLSIVFSFPPTW